MTAPPRLARHIRFALSDLSSQNAHHEFEHLCRHIAKRRIGSKRDPGDRAGRRGRGSGPRL